MVNFLTNIFLTPKRYAPCLNIWWRKLLRVPINFTAEEVAWKFRSVSALMIAKNIFKGIVLLLYGNHTKLKWLRFLLSYKEVWMGPHFYGDEDLDKKSLVVTCFPFLKSVSVGRFHCNHF